MEDIFLAIQARIKAKVAEIRFIDFDLGQFEKDLPCVSYPAILIGFDNTINWSDLGAGVQQGSVAVSIRIGFKVLEKTHSVNSSTPQAAAFTHFSTAGKVNKYLNGLEGANFTKLSSSSTSYEQRDDIRVFGYTFVCTYYDERNNVKNDYTSWQALDPNPFGNIGPGLSIYTDIVPSSMLQNINNWHVEGNESTNYHETLTIDGVLNIEGLLTEI